MKRDIISSRTIILTFQISKVVREHHLKQDQNK